MTGAVLLQRTPRARSGRYVVASDDPNVHELFRNFAGVDEVVFLEDMEAYFSVSGEVLRILGMVNRWLASLDEVGAIPRGLLYWVQHVEGGDTTQRIQDALLLVRSYFGLMERVRPSEIVVVRNGVARWEDDLLRLCAKDAGIAFRFIGKLGWRGRGHALWLALRPLAKELYLSAGTLAIKLRSLVRRPMDFDQGRLVVVQLCSSARKHLGHTESLVAALDAADLDGVALCWGAGKSVGVLQRGGRRVVELESWVGMGDLVSSWVRTVRTGWRAHLQRRSFLPLSDEGRSIQLVHDILWRSIGAFIMGEVAHRYRLDRASRKFLGAHLPRAVRFWTRILPQGVIAFRALPPGCRPLLFWQPGWPYQIPSPYTRHDIPADVVFAISEEHRRQLLGEGMASEQIVVSGHPWLRPILEFKDRNTKEASRKSLGIAAEGKLCVLCDSGEIVRGYMAPAEQALLMKAMLDMAQSSPALHLIIKPHPIHRTGVLDALLRLYNLNNLTLVPKGDLPYHAMNAADVIVTKYSTLAIQGMVLRVPSIGVLLDRERRFAYYEDAMAYVYTIDDLRRLIENLLGSATFRRDWQDRLQVASSDYLRRHGMSRTVDTDDLIAAEIKNRLH